MALSRYRYWNELSLPFPTFSRKFSVSQQVELLATCFSSSHCLLCELSDNMDCRTTLYVQACHQQTDTQYTPPTPTWRNCRVASRRRRRCVLGLSYASPSWWGFANDRHRLKAFLRRSAKLQNWFMEPTIQLLSLASVMTPTCSQLFDRIIVYCQHVYINYVLLHYVRSSP